MIEFIKILIGLFIEMAPYILLGLVFVGLLNLIIKKESITHHLGENNFISIVKASLFGVPLPLCSCGVIPTTVYFAKSGASKGSVISFLTSTPQTGVDSIIATYGMMGPVFAVFRPFAALMMGIINGTFINKFFTTKENESLIFQEYKVDEQNKSITKKFKTFINYSFVEFLDDIAPQFIVGLIIAAAITYFIPDNFFSESVIQDGILGMLAMIVVGVPMYICATASIPIAVSLIAKGFSPGVAFVFLAVGPATNAASFAILTKVLGKKIAIAYLFALIITSILFGYILDFIFKILNIDPITQIAKIHYHHTNENISYLTILISIFFLILLIMSFYRIYLRKYFKKQKDTDMITIKVKGMNCNHCVNNVTKIIQSVEGTKEVKVDLSTETAMIKGTPDLQKIKSLIEEAGYQVELTK